MKHVPSLTEEPPGLSAWRAANPADDQATGDEAGRAWQRFKDEDPAYRELLEALIERQQGLCGYCEQRLTRDDGRLVVNDYQVEHVEAKSTGTGRTLDWHNFMLCCGGGTWPHHVSANPNRPSDPTRYRAPARHNISCGQAKGDDHLPRACDPRGFPWQESLVEIGIDGRMRARPDACQRAGVRPEDLDTAINDRLSLNCERLRVARQAVANEIVGWVVGILGELDSISPNLSDEKREGIREDLVGGRLQPDANGHLCRFWTTERQFLGELAEAWIRKHEHAAVLNFV